MSAKNTDDYDHGTHFEPTILEEPSAPKNQEQEKIRLRPLVGATDSVTRVSFIPKLNSIAIAGNDGMVRIYSVETGGRPVVEFDKHVTIVSGLTMLTDDIMASVAMDEFDEQLFTWRTNSGKRLGMLNIDEVPTAISKLSDSSMILGTITGDLLVVTHYLGSRLRIGKRIENAHSGWIDDIVIQSTMMLTRSTNQVKVWDTSSLQVIETIQHESQVSSATMNEKNIITGCSDGRLYIRRNAKPLFPIDFVLDTLEDDIRSIQFLTDDVITVVGGSGCLGFISISSQSYLARLKISPTRLNISYILEDGNVVIGGDAAFSAIISSPEKIKQLTNNRKKIDTRTKTRSSLGWGNKILFLGAVVAIVLSLVHRTT